MESTMMDPPEEEQPTTTAARKKISNPKQKRTWEENYAILEAFQKQHGHCRVPAEYKPDQCLAYWITHTRENRNQPFMTAERKAALDAIGFDWNPQWNQWRAKYDELVEHKKKTGNCKPTSKDNYSLFRWAIRQREAYWLGRMEEQRVDLLTKIGFEWGPVTKRRAGTKPKERESDKWEKHWESFYQKLKQFHAEHGHSNVPHKYEPDVQLAVWVKAQRHHFRANTLSKERTKRLEELDFQFEYRENKLEQNWNSMLQKFKDCQEGDELQIPKPGSHPDATSIARWVQRQREAFKQHKLAPERYVILKKLNFTFPTQTQDTPANSNTKRARGKMTTSKVRAGEEESADDSYYSAASTSGVLQQQHDHEPYQVEQAVGRLMAKEVETTQEDAGKKIAESIDNLAKYLAVTPVEIATKLTAAASPPRAVKALDKLLPRIVQLREEAGGKVDDMVDCSLFWEQVLRREKKGGLDEDALARMNYYDKLIYLALELDRVMANSKKKRTIFDSCESHLLKFVKLKEDVSEQKEGGGAPLDSGGNSNSGDSKVVPQPHYLSYPTAGVPPPLIHPPTGAAPSKGTFPFPLQHMVAHQSTTKRKIPTRTPQNGRSSPRKRTRKEGG